MKTEELKYNTSEEFLFAVEEFTRQYGNDTIVIFAQRRGLSGFDWTSEKNSSENVSSQNNSFQNFVSASELPRELCFENHNTLEIRVFGGIQNETEIYSLDHFFETLKKTQDDADSSSDADSQSNSDLHNSPRLFLLPSYFPWESETQQPAFIRIAKEEKRFVLPASLIDAHLSDTPLSDTPLSDTPLSDTPLSDTPLSDTPLSDTPLSDTPLSDTPLSDTPLSDTPPSTAAEETNGRFQFESKKRSHIEKTIGAIQEKMRDGDCYLMNYTTRVNDFSLSHGFSALHFAKSWLRNPSRFGVFYKSKSHGVMSFSPERFVATRGGWIATEPIKGTIKAQSSFIPTLQDAHALWNMQKEICEHTMVVDLLRNDLNGICVPGTVGVWQPFFAGIAGSLLQMQSTVFGKLLNSACIGDFLKNVLPAGSVTGTPKWRVCELTEQLEPERRGYYTGIFGVIDFNKTDSTKINCSNGCNCTKQYPPSLDTVLLIRSLFLEHGKCSAGVGAGITTLSNPTQEVDEFEIKLRSFLGKLES